jgi:hypothetical protein
VDPALAATLRGVEILLVPVLIVWVTLPFAVVIGPPVVALTYRRLTAGCWHVVRSRHAVPVRR